MTSKVLQNTHFLDIHTHSYNNYRRCSKAIYSYNPGLNQFPSQDINFCIGIHPWSCKDGLNLEELNSKAIHPKCLFIGESGLDLVRKDNLDLQRHYLIKHIELSEILKKPLVLHNVKASNELLSIHKKLCPKMPWILHDFNGSKEEVNSLSKINTYFSLGPTFMKENSRISKASGSIEVDRLFFETDDSDFLIEDIYKKFADNRKIDLDKLSSTVDQNYNKLLSY